eukprot:gene28348-37409_t
MASALAALYPSPLLATLTIIELGVLPKTYMECTVLMSISSFISFAIYYELQGVTYLEHLSTSSAYLSTAWLQDPGYQSWQLGTAFIIGVVCAALGMFILLCLGIMKQVFARLRNGLSRNKFLKTVVPLVLAGILLTGAVNYALPLTVGNGNLQFTNIVKFGGINGELSQNLLICSGFARVFTFSMSMSAGYNGGFIFPIISIGLIAGTVFYLKYPYIPYGMCVGTFMVALPSGIAPMPYTMTLLSVIIFFFGTYQTIPIFVSVITTYTIICGSGLLKAVTLRQRANQEKAQEQQQERDSLLVSEDSSMNDITQRLFNKQEEEDYAMS